jgi:hypothetical protein
LTINVYSLGGTEQIRAKFSDPGKNAVAPSEMRISIKDPLGQILTVSGAGLTPHQTISGMFYTMYRPLVVGWYEYESWGKDGNGNEVVQTNGFEVIDKFSSGLS